jgi:hypothetical protein
MGVTLLILTPSRVAKQAIKIRNEDGQMSVANETEPLPARLSHLRGFAI